MDLGAPGIKKIVLSGEFEFKIIIGSSRVGSTFYIIDKGTV
jgi:hypothetical protein